jgi:tetratricopeptide (TPR) repeat protein
LLPIEIKELLRVACAKLALPSGFAIATGASSFDCLRDKIPIYKATDLGNCSLDNCPPDSHEHSQSDRLQSKEDRLDCPALPSSHNILQNEQPDDPALLHGKAARSDETIACYQQALILKPDDADAHFELGNALTAYGRLDDAMTSYQRACEAFKAQERPYEEKVAIAYEALGRAFEAQEQMDKANTCFDLTHILWPQRFDAWSNK